MEQYKKCEKNHDSCHKKHFSSCHFIYKSDYLDKNKEIRISLIKN
ncbi:hypothetical protein CHCC15136_1491 [Bacillus paralicheniformis]|nr:hypothetical protein SC10_B2orf05754 [Bacillus paralicheniformis]TWM03869.1 hypothetical protein CHCC15136_1491 [Bacillus paralicheniformis]